MSVLPSEELVQKAFAAVNAKQRTKNQEVLQPILNDLITLGRVVKQLHWNVVGPHFRPIHQHLDEVYATIDEAVDDVAERIAATGHSPDGRIREVAAKAEIEDAPAGFLADQRVLLLAAHAVKQACELIRSRTETIEDVDVVTADLLHQIVMDLEKHHWMLEASRV
ncbi:MAG TPA: DNA starvation/stationary phase protection protein [Fimbriimonadaceae bacterium]|nr:DNA starvation/stationary phase protection protein [Fimbriimonadaceae bacterium]